MFPQSSISQYDTPFVAPCSRAVGAYRVYLLAETPADDLQFEMLLPGVYCGLLGNIYSLLPNSAGEGEGLAPVALGPAGVSRSLPPVYSNSEKRGKIGEAVAAPSCLVVVGGLKVEERLLLILLPVVVIPSLGHFCGGWWSQMDRARITMTEKKKGPVAAVAPECAPRCLGPALEVFAVEKYMR